MTLRIKFIAFITLIHAVTFGLSFFVFREKPLVFIFTELFILFSLFLSWRLYVEMINPLKLILTGIEAIKDRDFNIKFVDSGNYEMDQLIHVYNQMIDELRYERTVQEQQHYFLDKLIHTSPTGIVILDFDDHITSLNPRAQQMLQDKDGLMLHKHLSELDHPILQVIRQLDTGASKTITLNGVETYKCRKAHFVDRGFPRFFVMIEELSAEIFAAEKKAFGKVIRMMAHEVNNSIGAINSILHSVLGYQDQLPADNRGELVNALRVAIDRNDRLNRFMRKFADVVRIPSPRPEKMDVHVLVGDIAKLFDLQALERDIRFRFDIPEQPFYILADRQQMEQVLINIVKNAMESIGIGGEVVFETRPRERSLIIRDNGKGIPAELEAHLFSPFYTTKKDGQGIGLTLIRDILTNHGFGFSLKTRAPGVTEFLIMINDA